MLVALLLHVAFVAWAFPRLPEQVPVHWNVMGQANRWEPAGTAAIEIPLLAVGLYGLMLFAPIVDPRRRNYALFPGALRLMRWLTPILVLTIHTVSLMVALGYVTNMVMWVQLLVGALLVLMGNVMGQVRHNYFMGVRTPWTLASEENWRRTHRLAAPLWVGAGLVSMVSGFLPAPWNAWLMMGALGVAGLAPYLYSYLIFARARKA